LESFAFLDHGFWRSNTLDSLYPLRPFLGMFKGGEGRVENGVGLTTRARLRVLWTMPTRSTALDLVCSWVLALESRTKVVFWGGRSCLHLRI